MNSPGWSGEGDGMKSRLSCASGAVDATNLIVAQTASGICAAVHKSPRRPQWPRSASAWRPAWGCGRAYRRAPRLPAGCHPPHGRRPRTPENAASSRTGLPRGRVVSTAAISYPRSRISAQQRQAGSQACSHGTVSSAPRAVLADGVLGRAAGDAAQVQLFDAGGVAGAEECAHVIHAAHVIQQHRHRQRARCLRTSAPALVA